jgi:hypothetical protein
LHDLGEARRGGVDGGGGPHQRNRLREVADIVVGPAEQFGIGAGGGEVADQGGLGGGEAKLAGDGGEAEATVGVGRGRKIVAQQRDLAVARGGEDEAFEQVGEQDHASASSP